MLTTTHFILRFSSFSAIKIFKLEIISSDAVFCSSARLSCSVKVFFFLSSSSIREFFSARDCAYDSFADSSSDLSFSILAELLSLICSSVSVSSAVICCSCESWDSAWFNFSSVSNSWFSISEYWFIFFQLYFPLIKVFIDCDYYYFSPSKMPQTQTFVESQKLQFVLNDLLSIKF